MLPGIKMRCPEGKLGIREEWEEEIGNAGFQLGRSPQLNGTQTKGGVMKKNKIYHYND